MQLLVRGGQQGSVVGLGQVAAFPATPAVDEPVVQVRAVPAAVGLQPGHRDPARALARHPHDRGVSAPAPGPRPGRAQGLAGLVLEADPRPLLRR